MTRFAVPALLLVVLLGANAFAKPGIVKTNNGQTYEGEVDEHDPTVVVIVVKGIQSKIDRGQIASITYTGDKQQELQARVAKLDPKDVNGRVALAREAMAAEQYTVARDVLESARQIDPNNADVVSLLETVQSQLRLQRNAQRPPEEPRTAQTATATVPSAGDAKLLRPAEINAIRQAETRFPDDNVRIRFEHNVLRRFVDYIGKDEVPNFYALNQLQQANLILEKGPRELSQDVTIMNDPPALMQYRRAVQPFIVLNCATATCHAGGATKFRMVTPAESDAATYTNFYTIAKYVKSGPTADSTVFGQANPRMIDRQHPETSLLLQYSLPGALAESDHPDVRDYRPPLRSKADPRYRQLNDWIGTSLKPVDPQYTFEAVATTQATQPATQPAVTAPAAPAQPVVPHPPARPARPAPGVVPPPPAGVLR